MTLKLKKYKFHLNKSPILTNDIDINKIVVPDKLPFAKQDFKYLICYNDSEKKKIFMHILPTNDYMLKNVL